MLANAFTHTLQYFNFIVNHTGHNCRIAFRFYKDFVYCKVSSKHPLRSNHPPPSQPTAVHRLIVAHSKRPPGAVPTQCIVHDFVPVHMMMHACVYSECMWPCAHGRLLRTMHACMKCYVVCTHGRLLCTKSCLHQANTPPPFLAQS